MIDIPENVTLEFIARQIVGLRDEVRDIRLEMNVQGAILLRMEGTQRGFLNELTAMHEQARGFEQRLRKLEDAPK